MSHQYEGPRRRRTFDPQTVQMIVKTIRDLAIFVLGAYAFVHELSGGAERPQILIMSAAMMGLPVIIRGDEKRQEGSSRDAKHKSP